MKKFITSLFIFASLLLQSSSSFSKELITDLSFDVGYVLSESDMKLNLYEKCNGKCTIGVIPYYNHEGKTYFLLGREALNTTKSDSGEYSDFGGNAEIYRSLLCNMKREFNEETSGLYKLTDNDLISDGILIYKKAPSGRDIFYVFYKFTDKEFENSKKFASALNNMHSKGCSCNKPFLEKDDIKWVETNSLLKATLSNRKEVKVKLMDGSEEQLILRKYFVKDCLNRELIKYVLRYISGVR